MVKVCPQCNLEVDVDSLGCECGYCFVDNVIASQAADELQVLRVRRKHTAKRVLTISAVAGLLFVSIAYFSGLLQASEEPAFTEAPVPATAPQPENANSSTQENAGPVEGKPYRVTNVSTGDYIEVVDENNQQFRIALFGVRAPKLNEQFGTESRQNLTNLVLGKVVILKTRKTGSDGIFFAEVLSGNQNVGLTQVEAGLVTVATEDLVDQTEFARRGYLNAEIGAKTSRFGLWSGSKELLTTPADGQFATSSVPEGFRPEMRPMAPVMGQPAVPQTQFLPDPNAGRQPVQEPRRIADVPVSTPPTKVVPPEPKVVERPKPQVTQNAGQAGTSEIKYTRGPRGGCYYLTPSGSKKYVDRSICN